MPGAFSSRESGSVVLIFRFGVSGTWWGLGGSPPKRRPARAWDRPRLARAALLEALAGVTQPAAAALVDRGLKKAFRDVYRASSRDDAEQRLDTFLVAVDRAGLPAFDAFARSVRSWQEELLAYFEEPTTNGYAEGVINKVKVIKRRAHGLPTFSGFRKRVVIACG
jgi:transposase